MKISTPAPVKMSVDRSLFCLFLVFDFCLTTLIWFLWLSVAVGSNIREEIINEILQYNIYSSFFDFIVLSLVRVVLLIFFYGVCASTSLWACGVITLVSSALILVKVFLTQWLLWNQTVYTGGFILTSFLLPWFEFWFLGLKVIPKEENSLSEQTRLLNESVNMIASDTRTIPVSAPRSYNSISRRSSFSSAEFYSIAPTPTR